MATKPTMKRESKFGIYVHVPFCRRLCPYCDFNVHLAKRADWPGYAQGVCAEVAARAPAFASSPTVDSIYFGGGTPSLAPGWVLEQLLQAIAAHWPVAAGAEVTVEVDPKTLAREGFVELRRIGVNRISLGWQSTHDQLLRVMGRGHSAEESRQALAWARDAGFDEVSVDLIFGVPGESMADLEGDLDVVLALAPEHVSLYALTFHEGTTFYRWRARGRLRPVDEELEAAMMERIEERLTAAGYEHYEVSNYARPGLRSAHNSLYWSGAPYLGLGPGAHSFLRDDWRAGWRWESTREPAHYAEQWRERAASARVDKEAGRPSPGDATVSWVEELSRQQLACERFLLALRLKDGMSARELEALIAAGATERDHVGVASQAAAANGWLELREGALVPTSRGLMNADALAALFC